MRFLKSLTARVIIGSLILAATAAGLSIATSANQNRLNQEIRVIRTGYLPLALRTRDLTEKQRALVDYLRDDLVGESSARRVEGRIRRSRDTREKILGDIASALEAQTDAPATHEKRLARGRVGLDTIREMVIETEPLYEGLLADPPIERRLSADLIGPLAAPLETEGNKALSELQRLEGRIHNKTRELASYQQRNVEVIARGLERGSNELARFSLMFLIAAVVVGLAVIIFTGLTLSSIRRLPIVAQRLAAGDYAARIPETGPTEVEDLAREFNQMASALEGRERELVRSERLATVGKMAAMITHEVRNPLSAIGLNSELLEEELGELGDGAAEARGLCKAINTEIDRLTEITETYLQFARLPQPRLHAEDLGELASQVVRFLGEEMSSNGIDLSIDVEEGLPSVEVDHAQIKQGLLNLIRNGAEALAETKQPRLRVRVTSSPDDKSVVMEVSDNGPGIPADVLPRLFEAFFTTKTSGTGLGLALTQQIVREHSGTLEVFSKLGSGTRFTISLPRVSGPSVLAD